MTEMEEVQEASDKSGAKEKATVGDSAKDKEKASGNIKLQVPVLSLQSGKLVKESLKIDFSYQTQYEEDLNVIVKDPLQRFKAKQVFDDVYN